MKKGILVCARTGSTRLPNKMIMEINGRTTIEHLIDRLKQSRYCDEIVFCTTQLEEDDVLANIAEHAQVSCYRGSNEDKLDRWYKAALQFDIDYFVNVDGDDLFCEPELIDLAFSQHNNTNHDFVKCDESKLVAGIFTFGIKTDILGTIWKAKTTTDTEGSWLSFHKLEFLRAELLQNIPEIYYRPEIRATLDYEEDFLFFKTVIDYFDKVQLTHYSLRDIILFLDKNLSVISINSFRHNDFLENQKKSKRLTWNEKLV